MRIQRIGEKTGTGGTEIVLDSSSESGPKPGKFLGEVMHVEPDTPLDRIRDYRGIREAFSRSDLKFLQIRSEIGSSLPKHFTFVGREAEQGFRFLGGFSVRCEHRVADLIEEAFG